MEIKRDSYLEQLISYRFDGLVKVITGIRRCGKSYLLKNIYRNYLIDNGVKEEQIITIELDLAKDIKYRNPLILSSYVREKVEKAKTSIIFSLMKFKCLMKWLIHIIRTVRKLLFTTLLMI